MQLIKPLVRTQGVGVGLNVPTGWSLVTRPVLTSHFIGTNTGVTAGYYGQQLSLGFPRALEAVCQELGAERTCGFPIVSQRERGPLLPSSPQGSFQAGQSLVGDAGHGWGGRGHWSGWSWTTVSSHHGQQHADPHPGAGLRTGQAAPTVAGEPRAARHRLTAGPRPGQLCRTLQEPPKHPETPPSVHSRRRVFTHTASCLTGAWRRESRLLGQVSCTLHRVQRVK